MKNTFNLFVVLGTLASSTAFAESDPRVAITISPVHFILPVGELTAEVRVAEKLGVAAVVGAGAVKVTGIEDRIAVWEGGVSARYYVTGSFRKGLQLGGEALYLHANTTGDTMAVRAQGLGLSPFVGYKWTAASGLTLDGQAGITYVAVRAESETDSDEDSRIGPMLNLNIGYSF
jgi:hypothetical protein